MGGRGDRERGDANVQDLIDNDIMKQWTEADGSVHCCYKKTIISRKEGVKVEGKTNKVCVVFLMHGHPCRTIRLL